MRWSKSDEIQFRLDFQYSYTSSASFLGTFPSRGRLAKFRQVFRLLATRGRQKPYFKNRWCKRESNSLPHCDYNKKRAAVWQPVYHILLFRHGVGKLCAADICGVYDRDLSGASVDNCGEAYSAELQPDDEKN